MKDLLNQIVANRGGAFAVFCWLPFLEAYGDSCFQSGLHPYFGAARTLPLACGTVALGFYGLVVKAPRWEFGKLLGVHVVLFFVVAQILARVCFNQRPTVPVLLGGALILAGGAVMSFWKP